MDIKEDMVHWSLLRQDYQSIIFWGKRFSLMITYDWESQYSNQCFQFNFKSMFSICECFNVLCFSLGFSPCPIPAHASDSNESPPTPSSIFNHDVQIRELVYEIADLTPRDDSIVSSPIEPPSEVYCSRVEPLLCVTRSREVTQRKAPFNFKGEPSTHRVECPKHVSRGSSTFPHSAIPFGSNLPQLFPLSC